jgi:hypothetical protein
MLKWVWVRLLLIFWSELQLARALCLLCSSSFGSVYPDVHESPLRSEERTRAKLYLIFQKKSAPEALARAHLADTSIDWAGPA